MKVAQSCPSLCDPINYTIYGILQARILEWVPFPFSKGSSQPRIEPRSPALQANSLPAEPQGKPKNTGVGSLSRLQGIFPTQESNPGFLHWRQILYQMSYQGMQICVYTYIIWNTSLKKFSFFCFIYSFIYSFIIWTLRYLSYLGGYNWV